jgi:hypothetical protein
MKTKKILLWSVVPVLVIGIAVGAYLWLKRPQIIILSDGTKLTLEAVTYGKRHTFPSKDGRRARTGTLNSLSDTLCLWIRQEHKPNQLPQYQLLAYDSANTACAGNSTMTYGSAPGRQGNEVVGILFDAFPRRGRKVYFRPQERNRQNGQQEKVKGEFVVKNPARGATFSKWKPAALPITQQDGDLEVTLTRLVNGAGNFNYYGQTIAPDDPVNKGVLAAFRIEQNGHRAANWQPVHIETSDATGNHTGNRGWSSSRENDEQILTYQWGLWPDEPAWKLRVELSRRSGFNEDELWTVTEIPFTPGTINDTYRRDKGTNVIAQTTLDDIHLDLYSVIKLSTDQARQSGGLDGVFRIRATPPPDGTRLTLVSVTDDQNRTIEFNNLGWGGGDYRFALRKLGDAKTINVKLALHRSRYVEFTAKPQMQAAKK